MLGPKSIINMIINTEDETAKIKFSTTDADSVFAIEWSSRRYV